MTIRRRGLLLATLLAITVTAFPSIAQPVLAAGPLRIAADAVYTLDPEDARVHVEIDMRVTNLKASTATVIYYYREIIVPIQPEARSIRASDGSGGLGVTTRKRGGLIEATVRLRANLYYQRSASFTVRYDLVGGAPRSESPIRVGLAFATFGVWAWGDEGRGSVEVRTPPGFGSTLEGDEMDILNRTSGQVLRAEPDDPLAFFAIVSAENPAAYDSTEVSFGDGVDVVVNAWPEDDEWDGSVSETLRSGLPELRELIGLDWPVEHALVVRERRAGSLEGYAGVFFTDDQRIDVSEDLDPNVILHEASHVWFNPDLFVERWIYEGLAEEYAWQVQSSTGGEAPELPERPDTDDAGFVRLGAWTFPEVIRDQETADTERYGYDTAFWVMHEIVEAVGVEQMREAFDAAEDDLTAYPGAGAAEEVAEADGWKRLLDLVQPLEQPDDPAVAAALEDFVLGGNEIATLDDRADARDAYRDLLAAGDGWAAPWYVREPLGAWRFDVAQTRVAEARAALDLRESVAAAAAAEGLEPDGAMKTAYEGATDGFDQAAAIGDQQLEALAAIADARAAMAAPLDLVAEIGLEGATHAVAYDGARAAFEAGRLVEATTQAGVVVAILRDAPGVGQQRILTGVVVVAAALVLLVAVSLVLRRRRRRARLATQAAYQAAAALDVATGRSDDLTPGVTTDAELQALDARIAAPDPPAGAPVEAAATEAYATLAADPAEAPAPSGDGPPDEEGGPARGASPLVS